MLYEKLDGQETIFIRNTRQRVVDGVPMMEHGFKAEFKYETDDGRGRIAFDSEKLAKKVLEQQIRAGEVDPYDEEAQQKRYEQILKLIDDKIQSTNGWKYKKIVPYRPEEDIIRSAGIFPCPYCNKVFTSAQSDNPTLDLKNHIQNTKDGKHPKIAKE